MSDVAARFMARVNQTDSCWLWLGALRPDGYARFGIARRQYYAHRVSYELFVGPIPEGLTIDHLCRVRHCVRPDHLEAVTNAVNVLRGEGITAREARQDRCSRGHLYAEHGAITPNGWRQCRACQRLSKQRRRDALAIA